MILSPAPRPTTIVPQPRLWRAMAILLAFATLASGTIIAWSEPIQAEQIPAKTARFTNAAPTADIRLLLGDASLQDDQLTAVIVTITNPTEQPLEGKVVLNGDGGSGGETTSNFLVPATSTIAKVVPGHCKNRVDVTVRLSDNTVVQNRTFHPNYDSGIGIVEIAEKPRLGPELGGIGVPSRHPRHGSSSARSAGSGIRLWVQTAYRDSVTGDAYLPSSGAIYGNTSLVVITESELGRLADDAVAGLSDYVLGGGSVALVMDRPESVRSQTLASWVGGPIEVERIHPAGADPLPTDTRLAPSSAGRRSTPTNRQPPGQVALDESAREQLHLYLGGNLRPTESGSSAAFGVGVVHVLSFNPYVGSFSGHPWTLRRLANLARLADEHQAISLDASRGRRDEIVRSLDPNRHNGWAAAFATLLLLSFAVFAGPISFGSWRKKGKPLRAVLLLPVYAAFTFMAVQVVATLAKGVRGKAFRVTIIEAGAGMATGIAQRHRIFYVPDANELNVYANSRRAIPRLMSDDVPAKLNHQSKRAFLENVSMPPWQAVEVHEEGRAQLGSGVSLVRAGTEVTITNGTGKNLRGLLLWSPGDGLRHLSTLEDGATIKSTSMAFLGSGRGSGSSFRRSRLQTFKLEKPLKQDSARLYETWIAIMNVYNADWAPRDAPVLYAQIDGGEGLSKDSGFRVITDRLLVRIVGTGVAP